MLRALLSHADDDPQTGALAREGGGAFVSQALRPYLIAALLERDPGRPAIVVAGDDDRGAAAITVEQRRDQVRPQRLGDECATALARQRAGLGVVVRM